MRRSRAALCAAPGCGTVPRKHPIYCSRHLHLAVGRSSESQDLLGDARRSSIGVLDTGPAQGPQPNAIPSEAWRPEPRSARADALDDSSAREAVEKWFGQMEHCRPITSEAADAWLNDWDLDLTDEQQQIIDAIDQTAEPIDMPYYLFRGLDLTCEEWDIGNFDYMTSEGQEFRFPAPQSFSDERDTAAGFAYLNGEAIRPVLISVEPGRIRAIDRFRFQNNAAWAEGEYLVPADTPFTVVASWTELDEESGIETRRVRLRPIEEPAAT